MKNWFNNFHPSTLVILFLGVCCFIIGWAIDCDNIFHTIFIKIGEVLVIGVVIGFVTNASVFLNMVKGELEDIVFGNKFLGKQKNIESYWETISKQMFKNKFPMIHREFLKTLKNYFPNIAVSFYDDYETRFEIDWVDKEKGLIKVTNKVSFNLYSESDGDCPFEFHTWVNNNINYENSISEITVNEKPGTTEDLGCTEDEGMMRRTMKINLNGNTRYKIKFKRIMIYSIFDDYSIRFRTQYITRKLRVCLSLPNGIEAQFNPAGTQDKYENVSNTATNIEKKYEGILFPKQGFVFSLKLKN